MSYFIPNSEAGDALTFEVFAAGYRAGKMETDDVRVAYDKWLNSSERMQRCYEIIKDYLPETV